MDNGQTNHLEVRSEEEPLGKMNNRKFNVLIKGKYIPLLKTVRLLIRRY